MGDVTDLLGSYVCIAENRLLENRSVSAGFLSHCLEQLSASKKCM